MRGSVNNRQTCCADSINKVLKANIELTTNPRRFSMKITPSKPDFRKLFSHLRRARAVSVLWDEVVLPGRVFGATRLVPQLPPQTLLFSGVVS